MRCEVCVCFTIGFVGAWIGSRMERVWICNTCNQRNGSGARYCVHCGASRNSTVREPLAYEAFEDSDGEMTFVSDDDSEMEEVPLLETTRERTERRRNTFQNRRRNDPARRQRAQRELLNLLESLIRELEEAQQQRVANPEYQDPDSVKATAFRYV